MHPLIVPVSGQERSRHKGQALISCSQKHFLQPERLCLLYRQYYRLSPVYQADGNQTGVAGQYANNPRGESPAAILWPLMLCEPIACSPRPRWPCAFFRVQAA